MFEDICITELFDNESEYGKEFTFENLSDDLIKRAEMSIGYKLPTSYVDLLKIQNGGVIKNEECWLSTIYGIAPDIDCFNGLEAMYENWIDEWEYPNIGIPFGDTESGGHDIYFMDYSNMDDKGEPRIVRIENEGGPEDIVIKHVADNFEKFIHMILNNENIDGM